MPFDVNQSPDVARQDRANTPQSRRLVATWLFAVAGMILVMVVLGGATRLTGSGLSIMEWDPLMGALPPMSNAEWNHLFDLYKQIPQYKLMNAGFGLSGFKHIFWLEWFHRLWGRLIGVVFLLPLIWLWATGRVQRSLVPRLGLFFIFGGLQGAVGWFMVASGFEHDATSVSPARLVAHLSLALTLYVAILWTGLSVRTPARVRPPLSPWLGRLSLTALGLLCVTIVAGGFTAGLHAGLSYNTFPLMDGHLVPEGYASLHPFIRNLTQNIAAVQFDHRLMATITLLTVLTLAVSGWRAGMPRGLVVGLGAAVLCQYALGVTTLLLVVPIPVAVTHQAGGVVLLTMVVLVVHWLVGPSAARSRPAAPAPAPGRVS